MQNKLGVETGKGATWENTTIDNCVLGRYKKWLHIHALIHCTNIWSTFGMWHYIEKMYIEIYTIASLYRLKDLSSNGELYIYNL